MLIWLQRKTEMDTLLLCICTFIPCLFLYRLLFSKPSSSAGNRPPGPAPLPIVGNLLKLSARPNESLADLAAAFGPVMILRLGRVPTVVLTSAAAAKEALQKNDKAVAGRCLPDGVRVAGFAESSMVWRQANQEWRNLRLLCSKWMFSSARLEAGRGLREKKVRQLVELVGRCRTNPVSVGTIAFATMLNIISNTVFSVDLVDVTSESAQGFKDLVWSIMEEVGKPNLVDYFPLLRVLDPQGVRRKTSGYFKKLQDVFDGLIRERLAQRAGPKYEKREDFVEALLDLKENGEATQISTHEMKCLFVDLFAAGSETSSVTVEWAMAELLRHPTIMAKVKKELDSTLGTKQQVEESDITNRLPYLRAVVKETLRLHPPAPLLLPHRVESDIELCGYTIPKSTQLLINAWAITRDPSNWPEPMCFRPERFLDSPVDFRGQDFEFIPFGAGRRICPGLPLGDRMSHLMLASLLHSYDWQLPEGMKPEELDMRDKFGVTLQKLVPLLAVPTVKKENHEQPSKIQFADRLMTLKEPSFSCPTPVQ